MRTCTRCRRRRAVKDRRWCGVCSRRIRGWVAEQHGWPSKRYIRAPHSATTLTAETPSQRGTFGDRCPVCNQQLEFGTVDGVAVEWCPTHGLTVTPKEYRCTKLHDQRASLEDDLQIEVARESVPVRQKGRVNRMKPILVGGIWYE